MPRDAVPQEVLPQDTTVPPSGDRPGKVSVSVTATSAPGTGGRGRRVSCTVALAVAGALAAVTVGSVFVVRMLPDESGGNNDSAADGGARSTAPSVSSSAPAGTAAAVPARYLGTWEGQGTGLGGTVPMGTFRVTLHQARVGGELGRVRNTDPLGTSVCVDVLTLKKATGGQLVARAVGAGGNPATCVKDASTVHLTPVRDGLKYESDSSGSGMPVAQLAKLR